MMQSHKWDGRRDYYPAGVPVISIGLSVLSLVLSLVAIWLAWSAAS